MAFLRSASSTNMNCHSWRLPPFGAWTAIWRHSMSSSRDTGRSKSSRLRTVRVVVSSSSGDSISDSAIGALLLQTVPKHVVSLELLQRERPLGALRVLGGVNRLQQEVDVLRGQPDPLLIAVLDHLADGV